MAFDKYFMIGFSALGLGFALTGLYENFKKRAELSKAVRQLESRKFASVQDILDNIDKVIANSVAVRKRRDGKKSALIVLGGRLITKQELQSDHFQAVKLITKEIRTYPLNIHGERFKDYDKIGRKETTTPVYLKEFNLKNAREERSVLLAEFNSDRFSTLNSNIAGKDFMKKLSSFEDFVHRAYEMVRFACKLFLIDLTSLEAGFTEQEFGIQVNVPAFMLCTLTVASDGVPTIGKVQGVFPALDDLVKSLNRSIRSFDFNTIFLLVMSGFFVFVTTFAIKELRAEMRMRRLQQMTANALRQAGTRPAQGLKDGDIIRVDSYLCVACQVEPREVVHHPCSHLRYCRGCFDRLPEEERRQCSQCRAAVADNSILYFN